MATNSATTANKAPVTTPLSVSRSEDGGVATINLLEGAVDPDGNPLSVSTLVLTSGQKVSYTVKNGVLSLNAAQFNKLKAGETETLTFTYMVNDGTALVPQTLTVTITGQNDAPVVESALVATTTEDSAPLTVDLLAGASDVDGDALSVADLVQSGGPAQNFWSAPTMWGNKKAIPLSPWPMAVSWLSGNPSIPPPAMPVRAASRHSVSPPMAARLERSTGSIPPQPEANGALRQPA